MASQFFKDFIQVQKEIGKSTAEAIDSWISFKRKRDKDEIKKKLHLNTTGIILKSSRRDTTIVNCQFSIVNSLKYEIPAKTGRTLVRPFPWVGNSDKIIWISTIFRLTIPGW